MWIGLVRAILVITVFSVTSSVLITGLSMHLALPGVGYPDWVPFAIITPAIISPIVALVVMSLAYRLDEAHRALERLALTDPLTGAGNRRRFFDLAGGLRGNIERMLPPGKPGHVSVSIGVASGVGVGLSLEELLLEADRQLYVAKAEGRNRVAPAPFSDPETAFTNARSA